MPNIAQIPGDPSQLAAGSGGANPALLGMAGPGTLPGGAAVGGGGAPVTTLNGTGPFPTYMPGGVGAGYMGTLPGASNPALAGLPTRYTPYGNFTAPGGAMPNAPTPTSYGNFTAPDPANFQHSPSFQYDMDQAQKAIQRSAAARGSLLTGGTLKSLQENAMGLASRDYQNAFNNALSAYGANRDTNAQNFGQQHTAYGDALAGHQADFGNALAGYNTNRETQAQDFNQERELGAFQPPPVTYPGGVGGMANPPSGGPVDDYTAAVQAQRRAAGGVLPNGKRPGMGDDAYGRPTQYNTLAQRDAARVFNKASGLLARL